MHPEARSAVRHFVTDKASVVFEQTGRNPAVLALLTDFPLFSSTILPQRT
jgi:hypothetical protein